MMFRNLFRTLAIVSAFAAAAQANATPTLIVSSSGFLTGANNVSVDGTLYNVTFAGGSCKSLFKNCSASAFAFSAQASATSASQALLDQVFIDGPAGNFDTIAHNSFGCTQTLTEYCQTFTPYSTNSGTVYFINAINLSGSSPDSILGTGSLSTTQSTIDATDEQFAIFELATPATSNVPEPSSIALMGLAMAGLGFTRRRKANK